MAAMIATLCAFSTVATLITIVVFLLKKQKGLAGASALCSLALAIAFPILVDMDARAKGFLDLHDMQAALDADLADPVAWGKAREAVAAADTARLAAQKVAQDEALQAKVRQLEANRSLVEQR